jgi:hypothetical protein
MYPAGFGDGAWNAFLSLSSSLSSFHFALLTFDDSNVLRESKSRRHKVV